MKDDLFHLSGTVRRDPRIEAWFADIGGPLRPMMRAWFERMRGCGADVREVLHDGRPTACVGDAPFAYVDAFRAHASVGFYRGAMLADPKRLLQGDGKRMRHVKLHPGEEVDAEALKALIDAAYHDMQQRLGASMKDQATRKTGRTIAKKDTRRTPGDWRHELLGRIRALIKEADPQAVEELKWKKPSNPAGVPVWSHDGILCTGETYKNAVKMTFAKGAALDDPAGLFNASLAGGTRRAIDFHEGDKINEKALKALIRAAAKLNSSAVRAGKKVKAA